MRLALLVTNTDDSAFARARPDDAEKFRRLVAEVRPAWELHDIWLPRGEPPAGLGDFDGVMISGSPASVHDPLPWLPPLLDAIRTAVRARQPLFGACFGHQAIALALGGAVGRNPGGWAHGLLEVLPVRPLPWLDAAPLRLYGSHIEQVTALPPGAGIAARSPGCPIAGMTIGHTVFTTQHHPEMDQAFMAGLVEEYAGAVGPEVTAAARASLAGCADRHRFAEATARFFEQAVSRRR